MLQFNCPACNKKYETDDGYAGGQLICDRCGTHFFIPELEDFGDVIYEYAPIDKKPEKIKNFFKNFLKKPNPYTLLTLAVIVIGAGCFGGYLILRSKRLRQLEEQKKNIAVLEAELNNEYIANLKESQQKLSRSISELQKNKLPVSKHFKQHFSTAITAYNNGIAAFNKSDYSKCDNFFVEAENSIQWLNDNLPKYYELQKKNNEIAKFQEMLFDFDKDFMQKSDYQDVIYTENSFRNYKDSNFSYKLALAVKCIEEYKKTLKSVCLANFDSICTSARDSVKQKNWKKTVSKCDLILFAAPENNEFIQLRKTAEHNLKIQKISDTVKAYKDIPNQILPLIHDFIKLSNSSPLTDNEFITNEIINIYDLFLQSPQKDEILKNLKENNKLRQFLKQHKLSSRLLLTNLKLQSIGYEPLKLQLRNITTIQDKNKTYYPIILFSPEQRIGRKYQKAKIFVTFIGDKIRLENGNYLIEDIKNNDEIILRDRFNRKITLRKNETAYSPVPYLKLLDQLNGTEITVKEHSRFTLRYENTESFRFLIRKIDVKQKSVLILDIKTSKFYELSSKGLVQR